MTFWIVALGLAALVAAAILRAMLRTGPGAEGHPDIGIYRDQLAEVDRDLARGVLTEDEADRVRTEVSRRILEADRAIAATAAGRRLPRGLALAAMAATAVVLVGGAGALYLRVGAPGYPDLPLDLRIAQSEQLRRTRPSQAEAVQLAGGDLPGLVQADPEFLRLMEQLRATVAARPDDVEGLRLLARNEAGLGNYGAAAEAQQRIIDLSQSPDAAAFAALAEYLVGAAGGYVSPEAEAALTRALQLDPRNPRARYFAGLLYIQIGRPDVAFRFWRGLLEEGPADAPWMPPVRAEIMTLAQLAGVDYAPPAAAPPRGPSAADVAAASEMSDADRQQMIQGMVAGLAERLATEGGPPEDWARLIGAYGVLGETDRAAAIWAEAQNVFAGNAAALAPIRAAALGAGVASE